MRNSWICVDANLVVRMLMGPNAEAVRRLWDSWDALGRQLAAPSLLYYEVTNALYRYHTAGRISLSSARLAVATALALPISLYGNAELHLQAADLAGRLALPATYDAHYLALAERLEAEFWTADQRLVHRIQSALPWVHLAVV